MISPSDPQSAWTVKANKRVLFCYGLNYLIDIKHAVVVDVEATPAQGDDEVTATKTMLERSESRIDTSLRVRAGARAREIIQEFPLEMPLMRIYLKSVNGPGWWPTFEHVSGRCRDSR